jgi:hypothetical protein
MAAGLEAAELHGRLAARGIRTVQHRGREGDGGRITFVLTALHTPQDINQALASLADALRRRAPSKPFTGREDNYGSEYGSRIV